MRIARFEEGLLFGRRKLIRRSIAAALLHKHERTVVDDEMVFEKGFRFTKAFCKKSP